MNSENKNAAHAGIINRGLAYLIDCVFVFVIFAISQFLIFMPARIALGISNSWFRSGLNTEIYTLVTISIPVILYFSILESSPWRATIGKRLLRIQVLGHYSNSKISFNRALLRTLIKLAPWELAHIGNNLPEPIWYTDQPSFRIAFLLSGVLMTGYVFAILFDKQNRGVHDLLAASLVVNRPANQQL